MPFVGQGISQHTRSCPANEGKSTESGKNIAREPIPAEASDADEQEEPISRDLPAVCNGVRTTVQCLKEGCVCQCRRPDLNEAGLVQSLLNVCSPRLTIWGGSMMYLYDNPASPRPNNCIDRDSRI